MLSAFRCEAVGRDRFSVEVKFHRTPYVRSTRRGQVRMSPRHKFNWKVDGQYEMDSRYS